MRFGHNSSINPTHHAVEPPRRGGRIARICSARPIQIARPSRRIHHSKRRRNDGGRALGNPCGERVNGRGLKSGERHSRETQRARKPRNNCDIEEVLADVDPDNCRR
jgi:hypothetical protein